MFCIQYIIDQNHHTRSYKPAVWLSSLEYIPDSRIQVLYYLLATVLICHKCTIMATNIIWLLMHF